MSRPTLIDTDGHAWPITGLWCDDCGMPLAVALKPSAVHPTCGADS